MCKSNGSAGLEFMESLRKLVNVIANNKVPEYSRLVFFGAKLIAGVKKGAGLRSIAKSNTMRKVVAKCAVFKVSDKRKENYGKLQIE